MKRFLALMLAVTMIFSCTGGIAFADEQTERPESIEYANRIFFIPADEFKQISFEEENAFIQWGVMTPFIYDIKWNETGTEVYMLVDPQEERNSSNILMNSDHMPVTILTKDNVKSLRIFDGDTYV
ncbi:MAG: hypothetical protein II354_02285, partial [Firmicutes bacterium]|nr:hypothetical protein [Bacillota bacterium]